MAGFSTTTLATIMGLLQPLAETLGVPVTRHAMETAEDFEALEFLATQLQELAVAGKTALADGRLTAEEIDSIVKEALDIPAALKALGAELKDRTLNTPDTDTPA